jgi:hypothetical protein
MKTQAICNRHYTPVKFRYPNAATPREVFEKWVDRLLAGAIGVGTVTILLFLLTLC